MRIRVHFYSYFKELAGCQQVDVEIVDGSTVGDLLRRIYDRFPPLAGLAKSTLVAVGVEYQRADFVLSEGEEVSLFPPVQGG